MGGVVGTNVVGSQVLSEPNDNDNDIISSVIKTTLLSENEVGVTGAHISPLDKNAPPSPTPYYNSNSNSNYNPPTVSPLTHPVVTNPIPFYAGWDESLRKFVVTNRLLSRRESGYEMNLQQEYQKEFKSLLNQEPSQNILSFTAAPLKGMNAGTTLYWQVPFSTYEADQFFDLGFDGFAPIGWRRFQFRHSILKSWLYPSNKPSLGGNSNLKSKYTFLVNKFNFGKIADTPTGYNKNIQTIKKMKMINRRVKKRYSRVKKHPQTPVLFPSGPVLKQVLPVHYIYIFYKRTRLPRDRYIKRRLRETKEAILIPQNKRVQFPDFTLRKRIKTQRKYHIKQNKKKNKKAPIIPRRMIFTVTPNEAASHPLLLRWRPLSKQKINKPIAEFIKEQRALRSKQRKKDQLDASHKQTPNIRVKQLRRRVQRQVIRSIWRYKPTAGGFIWPGDYLKFELIEAPKLQTNEKTNSTTISDSSQIRSTTIKVKRQTTRIMPQMPTQPKKYLLQKHNNIVIKKKLEKAHRSNKIKERMTELRLAI